MKARPILMSGPMVRAILTGQKTQTRRVVKGASLEWINWFADEDNHDRPAMFDGGAECHSGAGIYVYSDNYPDEGSVLLKSPYGQPGDRLWVRETIRCVRGGYDGVRYWDEAVYAADGAKTKLDHWGWQRDVLPAIHCPRGLSRITLEVVSVGVERLQEITEADAIAEGVQQDRGRDVSAAMGGGVTPWRCYLDEDEWYSSPITSYRSLWELINGPGSWAANPWVWRVEFKRVTE